MNCRVLTFAAVMGLLSYGFAQDAPLRLPIDVPKDASVNFEAEGAGKEILATVKHMLSGDRLDPGAEVDKLTVKTGAGNIDIKLDDLRPLVDKIHAIHVVSYTPVPNEEPFKRYEKRFIAAGLKRVILVPGDQGLLIMRHIGESDEYGIVVRQKDNILVLRTDGAPGLGDFGRVLFESLSRAVQQAVTSKTHKGS